MGKDLGTYHLRVEFDERRGYIQIWDTGARFTGGRDEVSPLNATALKPIYHDEKELFSCMVFSYTENNFSCDCNRQLFLDSAAQVKEDREHPCGNTIKLVRLTAIRPDLSEVVIYDKDKGELY
jgi:hypothetical protein